MLGKFKTIFKDYFHDFYSWSQCIPIDTDIELVQAQLPAYVTVDWQNPEPFGNGLLYPVTWIKGHRKKQRKYLSFIERSYTGCLIKGTL